MESEKEEEQKIYPDLKQFVLVQLERQIFYINQLLFQNQPFKALRLLKLVFELLPPDIKKKLKDERTVIGEYTQIVNQASGVDFFTTHVSRLRVARAMTFQLSQILGKIQGLLYDSYLRTGYRGLNLNLETETLETAEEPEKSEEE